jgi:hypothetical protein
MRDVFGNFAARLAKLRERFARANHSNPAVVPHEAPSTKNRTSFQIGIELQALISAHFDSKNTQSVQDIQTIIEAFRKRLVETGSGPDERLFNLRPVYGVNFRLPLPASLDEAKDYIHMAEAAHHVRLIKGNIHPGEENFAAREILFEACRGHMTAAGCDPFTQEPWAAIDFKGRPPSDSDFILYETDALPVSDFKKRYLWPFDDAMVMSTGNRAEFAKAYAYEGKAMLDQIKLKDNPEAFAKAIELRNSLWVFQECVKRYEVFYSGQVLVELGEYFHGRLKGMTTVEYLDALEAKLVGAGWKMDEPELTAIFNSVFASGFSWQQLREQAPYYEDHLRFQEGNARFNQALAARGFKYPGEERVNPEDDWGNAPIM